MECEKNNKNIYVYESTFYILCIAFYISVFEPMAIRDQMTMKRFLMIKMFLSAVSAGGSYHCIDHRTNDGVFTI